MSTWERIDANGDAHPLTQKDDKRAKQKFGALMDTTKMRRLWNPEKHEDIDEEPDHIVMGSERRDGTQIKLIGFARDLHGPTGVCTCCPRGAVAREAS